MTDQSRPAHGMARRFALDGNLAAVACAVFLMGLGEELWRSFVPRYLQALGASIPVIGAFGTVQDFLDGAYQYPGGWIADHQGRRRALMLFVALAGAGYGIYFAAQSWVVVFVGLVFVMAWSSMASPALFALIGDALPRERRTLGFTVQAIVRRVPMIVAPSLGGLWIASRGIESGVRFGLGVTFVLALATLGIVAMIRLPAAAPGEVLGIHSVWRSVHASLRRLLAADILIRTCEGLVDVFIVLYVTTVLGVPTWRYGILISIQMAASIASYFPAAWLAHRVGRKPFVIATFTCFALFPVAIAVATGFSSLVIAFVIGGLREIGEPSRKAMIVDSAEPALRARTVGLYYLVRSVAIAPASMIGAGLWSITPSTPFLVAGAIGILGTIVFALTVQEHQIG